MRKLYNRFQQFIDYFLFGIVTATLNVGLYFILNEIVGLHYLLANALSISVAILFSFYVNKKFVFKSVSQDKKVIWREFSLFAGSRLVSASIDMGGLFILVEWFGMNSNWAKVCVEILVATTNFLVSKFIIFK